MELPKEILAIDIKELYWAGGFFSGEGHTAVDNKPENYQYGRVRMSVGNTWLPNLKRFQKAVGGYGNIRYMKVKENRKPFWVWYCEDPEEVEMLLTLLEPTLSEEKQEQGADALIIRHRLRSERIIKDVGQYKRGKHGSTA